ncbi:hypothetical protein ERJ70_10455 [Sediminibacillus dalangtanensis]|uniref:DNA-directed RNA polymerase subunit beta n=1 Tax=Sediminibacillus dalangtanensis TaxID=2729421 RepID=A0ABX7VV88_9BACI|nr:hypothetical protein [Sediminibacillus dalangtanensis]QTM99685.1 hypothetical protein ERJ70_10455 [Sediminibacillus dalangtanensis]
MTEESSKDQARHLRSMVNELDNDKETETTYSPEQEEVNVLNLPPRKEVHQNKRTKVKWKVSLSLVRLLVILFLLIIAVIVSFQIWDGNQLFDLDGGQGMDNILPGWEQVKIITNGK